MKTLNKEHDFECINVVAQSHILEAEYTLELIQSLIVIHNQDPENKMSNVFSTEILC